MSSRSTRRRHHKNLKRLSGLSPDERLFRSRQLLLQLSKESQQRASSLESPLVWDLVRNVHVRERALVLDPSGELLADLDRVCAEAIAATGGRFMALSARPQADRIRIGETG